MAQRSTLVRSFSGSDIATSQRIYEYLANQEEGITDAVPRLTRDVTKSTMVIPTFQSLPSQAHAFAYKILVNEDSLHELERQRVLNWFCFCRPLRPIRTESDGNCLLHAASLYIWGVHDRRLSLRRFLAERFRKDPSRPGNLCSRWERAMEAQMRSMPASFGVRSVNCQAEWSAIVNMASSEKLTGLPGPLYAPLESIHIFALCNVLARPIVIVCDSMFHSHLGASIQPSMMDGIYLPVLRHETECEKSPIILAYTNGHFEPLLSSEDLQVFGSTQISSDAQHCIPLVGCNLEPLPVRFLTAKEEDRVEEVKDRYLELSCLPLGTGSSSADPHGMKTVLCAMISFKAPPAWTIQLMQSFYSYVGRIYSSEGKQEERIRSSSDLLQRCRGCDMECKENGEDRFNGFCERCYQNNLSPGKARLAVTASVPLNGWNRVPLPEEGLRPVEVTGGKMFAVCRTPGCSGSGQSPFHGLCYACYDHSLTEESYPAPKTSFEKITVKDSISPLLNSGRGQVPFSIEGGVILTSHSDLIATQSVTTEAGRQRLEDTHELIRHSQTSPLVINVSEKALCSIAGCGSTVLSGCKVCAGHATRSPCNMDGCTNLASDNDFCLCSVCLKEQREQQIAREGDQKRLEQQGQQYEMSRKEDTRLKEARCVFQAPVVYPGFPGRCNSTFSGPDERPLLTSAEGSNLEIQCCVPGCNNERGTGTDGYCGSCYKAVTFDKQRSAGNVALKEKYLHGKMAPSCCHKAYEPEHAISLPKTSVEGLSSLAGRHSLPGVIAGELHTFSCVMENCKGVGNAAYAGLCNSCHERNRKLQEETWKKDETKEATQKAHKEEYNYIPCETIGCAGQGKPEHGFLCNQCHISKTKKSFPRGTAPLSPCPTHDCAFYGSPEYGGLCSQCFADKTRLNTALDRRDRSFGSRGVGLATSQSDNLLSGTCQGTSQNPLSAERCRRPGCEMYGDRHFDGFCSQCGLTEQPVGDFTLIGWSKNVLHN